MHLHEIAKEQDDIDILLAWCIARWRPYDWQRSTYRGCQTVRYRSTDGGGGWTYFTQNNVRENLRTALDWDRDGRRRL